MRKKKHLFIYCFSIMPGQIDDIMAEHIIELFEKKDFKRQFIRKLNDHVDIPIINERTEKKVLEKIYDVLVDTLQKM